MWAVLKSLPDITFFGTSAEAKPTVDNGAYFIEIDTGKSYYRTGGVWVLVSGSGSSSSSIPSYPLFGLDGQDGEDGIEGPPGIQGLTGSSGAAGINGLIGPIGPPGIDAEEPEYPYIIPGPGGSDGGSVTTVEVDLGSTPSWRGKFTIVNAAITPTSKIIISQAPGPYTNKGTLSDEAEMDPLWCVAAPGSGSATVYWRTMTMISTFFLNILGQQQFQQILIGRIRGNVKFNYSIAS